ncbi:NAD(P)-dependent oxidoreductase, partial [Candidatus Bipolaricaulota bacterium]|nr:NAD(P)-dependent oxidoreductase [Candidatus Bipolaricaulota bacterium]
MTPVLGFIGFGEVASVFSTALSEHGARVLATDILLSRDGGEAVLRERMAGAPIELVSMSDLVRQCDVVLSTVTTMVACQVAEEAAPFLRQGQVYLDLNSTSPGVKKKIASIIDETPA